MQLSVFARILWAAGFVGHAALLLVLIVKERWRTFPFFTAWIGFSIIRTITLFTVYRYGSADLYALVYWNANVLDLLMQIAVIFEMARIVLKPTGTWVRDARRMFVLLGAAGFFIAAAIAFAVSPTAPTSFNTWIEKGRLFSVMLSLGLFLSTGLAATQLGLVWRNHVMGLATGWAAWAVTDAFVQGAASYLGSDWHGIVLSQIRMVVYMAAIIYWTIIFWLPEPESRTLSPEMQSYLSSLHKHVQLGAQGASSIDKR